MTPVFWGYFVFEHRPFHVNNTQGDVCTEINRNTALTFRKIKWLTFGCDLFFFVHLVTSFVEHCRTSHVNLMLCGLCKKYIYKTSSKTGTYIKRFRCFIN